MMLLKSTSIFTIIAAAAIATTANAAPIVGSVTIAGNDTYNSTSINFNPSVGAITSASGSYSGFAPVLNTTTGLLSSYAASLNSFQFAHASGVTLFTATDSIGQTGFFVIDTLSSFIGPLGALSLTGTGTAYLTGFNSTAASFNLLSSTTGVTGFQLSMTAVPANIVTPLPAVPEPATWAMMILGMGAVGYTLRRKVRANAVRFDAKIKSIAAGEAIA